MRPRRRYLRLHRQVQQLSNAADYVCMDRGIAAYLPDGRRNAALDAMRFELGYDAAWQRWSTATDESLDLAARIRRIKALDMQDLATKYDAPLWLPAHSAMRGCSSAHSKQPMAIFPIYYVRAVVDD